jgi:hypothetical protein
MTREATPSLVSRPRGVWVFVPAPPPPSTQGDAGTHRLGQQIALEASEEIPKLRVFLSLAREDVWIVAYRPGESRCGSNAGSVTYSPLRECEGGTQCPSLTRARTAREGSSGSL